MEHLRAAPSILKHLSSGGLDREPGLDGIGESEGDVQTKQLTLTTLETHCQHKLPSTGPLPPHQTWGQPQPPP